MKGFGKVGWTAAATGALAFALGSTVLPRALVQSGVDPRTAAGESLSVLLVVGPLGLLAGGVGGLIGQTLGLPGWLGETLLVWLPSIVNGLSWGALAEGIARARVKARVVFWALLLGLGTYWSFAVTLYVLSHT